MTLVLCKSHSLRGQTTGLSLGLPGFSPLDSFCFVWRHGKRPWTPIRINLDARLVQNRLALMVMLGVGQPLLPGFSPAGQLFFKRHGKRPWTPIRINLDVWLVQNRLALMVMLGVGHPFCLGSEFPGLFFVLDTWKKNTKYFCWKKWKSDGPWGEIMICLGNQRWKIRWTCT
jgi:hypothetical protein